MWDKCNDVESFVLEKKNAVLMVLNHSLNKHLPSELLLKHEKESLHTCKERKPRFKDLNKNLKKNVIKNTEGNFKLYLCSRKGKKRNRKPELLLDTNFLVDLGQPDSRPFSFSNINLLSWSLQSFR